jgi:hypothetical protein
MTVRTCGCISRENVGISNESEVRIFAVENPRFPGEGSSSQGQSGPKARPKGVADGQQVDIPVPPISVIEKQGHRRIFRARDWKSASKRGRSGVVKYASQSEGVMGRENKYRSERFHTGKKSCYRADRCPYRKPTQVDEERILRRAGEVLLRNSAN